MSKLVLLKSYYHKYEAEIVVGLLKQQGIEAILQSDDAGGFHNHLSIGAGNNRVLIQPKHARKALDLIRPLEEELNASKFEELEELALQEPEVVEKPERSQKKNINYANYIPLGIIVLFLVMLGMQDVSKRYVGSKYYKENVNCKEVPHKTGWEKCTGFYLDGRIRFEMNYKNGEPIGEYKEYHHNRQLMGKGTFEDGMLIGDYIDYYDNGNIRSKGWYDANRKPSGEIKSYYKSGAIMGIHDYRSGKLHGSSSTYCEDGKMTEFAKFENNKRIEENGGFFEGRNQIYCGQRLLAEEYYKNGLLEGEYKWYHTNGNLEFIQRFIKGERQGVAEEYHHETGNLISEYNYKDDEWLSAKEYDMAGKLIYQSGLKF